MLRFYKRVIGINIACKQTVERTKQKKASEEKKIKDKENRESGNHDFQKKTFHKPTFCYHCSDMLWGITHQGVQCVVCGFISHERCQTSIVAVCNSKASPLTHIPSVHDLVKFQSSKRRYCAVCRQKVEAQKGFKCLVCPYFIHDVCKLFIIHNCKQQATYTAKIPKCDVAQKHHWMESHITTQTPCAVCQKSYSNSESLTVVKCSWCLETLHSSCVSKFKTKCTFGVLKSLILAPYAVKPFTKSIKALTQQKHPRPYSPPTEPFQMNGGTTMKLRVYQGPINNPHGWRYVSFTNDSTTADILTETLNNFDIKEARSKYYLISIDEHNNEAALKPCDKFLASCKNNKPKIFLRCKMLNGKEVQVSLFAGNINSSVPYISLKINLVTPMIDVVADALNLFDMMSCDPNCFVISHVKLSPERVSETYLTAGDSIYSVLVDRKQTMREYHTTRFYLQPKEESFGVISLFIGNLPSEMKKDEYEKLLRDLIGMWNKDMSLEAIFPNNGAVVMKILSEYIFSLVLLALRSTSIDGKNLWLKVVPEILEDQVGKGVTPVLVLINSKSGGGQGKKLLTKYRRLLNPLQVADLLDGGPLPALYMFRNVRRFCILIGGGDGTFGWVLSSLEEIRYNILKCKQPPSALLPLGTGNDLSRTFNWGAGYSGESPLSILEMMEVSHEVMLDRWNVVFDRPYNHVGTDDDAVNVVAMNNYLSVGIDAEMCLDFHLSREENPEKFTSRLHNKGVYFKVGLRKFKKSNMEDLQTRICLKVDGMHINLPNIEGLAVNNIVSWGGGAEPWGKSKDARFSAQAHNDGLLEVIGFTGVYHMGMIKSGLSDGIRIAQGTQIDLELKEALPVQIDGEPWMQPKCSVMIRPTLQQAKMLSKPEEFRRRAMTSSPTAIHRRLAARLSFDLRDSTRPAVSNWYTGATS